MAETPIHVLEIELEDGVVNVYRPHEHPTRCLVRLAGMGLEVSSLAVTIKAGMLEIAEHLESYARGLRAKAKELP